MAKRVTSFDVARRAGVSRSIVSAVLNNTPGIGVGEEKRKAVLDAIEELNYRVDAQAKGMRTGRSYCIGVHGDLSNPMFTQMLQGLQEACKERGYHVLLCGVENRTELIELFMQKRIDGIVTKDTTGYADESWEKELNDQQVPFISVEGYPESSRTTSILMNYKQSVHDALNAMWALTKLPPVYLGVYRGAEYKPNWGDRERLQGYREWMSQHSCEVSIELLQEESWLYAPKDWEKWLEMLPKPVSIISNWSRGAIYIYRAANKLGLRIGEDVHIMAADNTESVNAFLVPALSAVEVPYPDMGRAAASRIIEYIEGKKPIDSKEKQWVPAKLSMRDSVMIGRSR
ncbi:LacI family DNA-binding transcriptional regulator [Paenibacillus sp. LjRoot56]|uniref:LacI family DNA-binding transcriptional regulator n=1 Tax=Paenibacillus sp. LjRoot56 TaxID=3342333 RepID=UPI003ED0410D